MERSLIKQVNRKNMGARLNSRKVKPVFFPNFFGVKQKDSLKWETLTGEKGNTAGLPQSACLRFLPLCSPLLHGLNSAEIKRCSI